MHVMIIGAGTGGLALAHGLKRAGIGVSVYERDVTPRDDQGGYRVGISPAGSRALKAYPSVLEAEDLLRMAQELTRGRHPNMRQLIRMTGPSAVRSINVRTSVPCRRGRARTSLCWAMPFTP